MMKAATLLLLPLSLSACATTNASDSALIGTANMIGTDGRSVGTASLIGEGNSLKLSVDASGLSSGTKGFHLHTTGKCDPSDFQSAGGHLNPYNKRHGFADPQGAHLGDLRNIVVRADGSVSATVDVSGARDEVLPLIFDNDGTAVMIHSGPDDYVTDPAGNAGSRIACGVLRPT